jgi:SagB-type dehydrogenase family enzyme
VAYWDSSGLVVENFLVGRQTIVTPPLIGLISWLSDYTTREAIIEKLGELPGCEELLETLIDRAVLVVRGTDADRRDADIDDTWEWSVDARFFHFATRVVQYEPSIAVQRASLSEYAIGEPPPPIFATRGSGRISLPGSFGEPQGELWRTLRDRRTSRQFKREPISLEALGAVLRWTWGATHSVSSGAIGPFLLKTSPSGGGRHPIEVYPFVLRVDGLSPGVYHYHVQDHSLGLVREGASDEEAVEMFAHQPWVRDAAVLFLMTAMVKRSMWKYKHAHAYRVLLLDAGHTGQTFHLVCTGLGLAPFTSSAKDDVAIERIVGVDGVREIALYAAATGWPAVRRIEDVVDR